MKNLRKDLAQIAVRDVKNPVLASLLGELHGEGLTSGRFNDTTTAHRDMTDRRRGHTDIPGSYQNCEAQKQWEADHHSDYEDHDTGRRHSHTDDTGYDDSHSDSGHNDVYSDITQ
jgi:hypothetical protein